MSEAEPTAAQPQALAAPARSRGPLARYRAKHPGSSAAGIFYHDLHALPLTALLLALYRLRVFGIPNVPRTGPLLIVANHQSYLDPPIIGGPICARRHLDYVARIGLFDHPLLSAYLRTLNTIPIRQDEPDAAAIRETLRRVQMGCAVLIFAEGSRTLDGAVQPFKRGIALLVRRAQCPVVPMAIEGAFDAWPRTRKLPRLLGCRIMAAYDRPISHEALMSMGPDGSLTHLRDRIESMRLDLRARLDRHGSRACEPEPRPQAEPS